MEEDKGDSDNNNFETNILKTNSREKICGFCGSSTNKFHDRLVSYPKKENNFIEICELCIPGYLIYTK